MIRTGAAFFFESPDDFIANCKRDPYNRGYETKPGLIPIKYPSNFPAAFRYEPDFDPRCVGSYVETDFEKACFAASCGLKSEIKKREVELSRLNALKAKFLTK